MKTRIIFYLFILLLSPANKTLAQQTRGLILLGNFRQAANISYDYDGRTSKSDGVAIYSRDHSFEEKYRIGLDYALYDTQLLRGHFTADILLDQEVFNNSYQDTGSSQGHGFHYDLTSVILQRKPYPINFFSSSGVTKVQRPFASNFDLMSDNYGAGFFLKNKYLPIQFNYSHIKTETSGLANDREQIIANYSLLAKHKVKNFSYTEARISHDTYDAHTKNNIYLSEAYFSDEISLINTLDWNNKGKGRSIFTSYRLKQELGGRDSLTMDFSEGLEWYFGKVLKGGAKYLISHQKSLSQTKSENRGDVWLKHTLFENLQTSVQFRGRSTDYPTGVEKEVVGTVTAAYQKKLPTEGLLQFDYSQSYGVVDRNLINSQIIIKDEPVIASYFTPITLYNTDVTPGSIVVRNENPSKRLLPYALNEDYTVDTIGRLTTITINPAGEIADGDSLLIDYQIGVNTEIKFANKTRYLAGALMLFQRRYRLYSSLSEFNQDLLSGRADAVSLQQSRTYRAGIEYSGESLSMNAEYEDQKSTYSVYQTINGYFRYTADFGRNSFNIYLKDRLTKRGVPQEDSGSSPVNSTATQQRSRANERTDNSLSVGVVYRRPVLRSTKLKFSADYQNITGLNPRDMLSLEFGVQAFFGKLNIDFKATSNWMINVLTTRRDDVIRFDLTRFF